MEFGHQVLEDELDSAVAEVSVKTHHIWTVQYARVWCKFYQLEHIRGNDLRAIGVLANGSKFRRRQYYHRCSLENPEQEEGPHLTLQRALQVETFSTTRELCR
jgi:hypothetical protein